MKTTNPSTTTDLFVGQTKTHGLFVTDAPMASSYRGWKLYFLPRTRTAPELADRVYTAKASAIRAAKRILTGN